MRLVGAGRPHIKFHQICNTFLKIPNFCPLNFAVQWEIECTLNLLKKKKKVLCCLSVTLQMPSYFFSKARRLTWLIRSLFTWMVDIQCITSLSFSRLSYSFSPSLLTFFLPHMLRHVLPKCNFDIFGWLSHFHCMHKCLLKGVSQSIS